MREQSFESLIDRIQHIESENAKLKRLCGLGAVVLMILMIIAASAPDGTREQRAERFLLNDKDGRVLAKLEALPTGFASFSFLDRAGATRIAFRIMPNQNPDMSFYDKEGHRRVSLSIGSDANPLLEAYDAKGNVGFGMGFDAEGYATMTSQQFELKDRHDNVRGELTTRADSSPLLVLRNEEEAPRALLSLTPTGAPSLDLLDAHGTRRLAANMNDDGWPGYFLFNKEAKTMAQIASAPPDGLAGLFFQDLNEKFRMTLGISAKGSVPRITIIDEKQNAQFTAP